MPIEKIVVVGAGTMGNGIAQVAATSGYTVTLTDVVPTALERAKVTISKSVDKLADKGLLTAEQAQAAKGIPTSLDLEPVREADLVIEAAVENLGLKLELFKQLSQLARPDVVLASNTSSISITKLGAASDHPGRVIGMHFFNPVPLMRL
jgi:3-hydroxybutyryl-CoA dehydrogenase